MVNLIVKTDSILVFKAKFCNEFLIKYYSLKKIRRKSALSRNENNNKILAIIVMQLLFLDHNTNIKPRLEKQISNHFSNFKFLLSYNFN